MKFCSRSSGEGSLVTETTLEEGGRRAPAGVFRSLDFLRLDKHEILAHPQRVVWRDELQQKLGTRGVCSRTMTRYIASGIIPHPDVQITAQRMGWRLSTLIEAGLDWV